MKEIVVYKVEIREEYQAFYTLDSVIVEKHLMDLRPHRKAETWEPFEIAVDRPRKRKGDFYGLGDLVVKKRLHL